MNWRRHVLGELAAVDELVVLVGGARRLVLHLLREVLEEAAPLWRGPELGDEVRRHLDALVREQHETGPRYVVDVVDVPRGGDGREVGLGLAHTVSIWVLLPARRMIVIYALCCDSRSLRPFCLH